jgi:farnesyl diphosphate synthase
MAKSAALEKFESIFPTLVEDVLAHSKSYNLPQQAMDWFKNVRRPRALHIRTQLTS